jgi:secondary thiamine-phosphate synthase enzyme
MRTAGRESRRGWKYMETIEIRTHSRTEPVEITGRVQDVVARSGVRSGVAVLASAHTTAAITVNEHADPDVMADMLATLARLVPRRGDYAHVEGNSDAHIKASLVGLSATVPVEDGRLVLGTWQGIYFCEFDGPRTRRALVQVTPAG